MLGMITLKEGLRNSKDSYVCPRCGYVLPKEDAVVSGYDSEGSLRHIHCPKRGKIITYRK